MKKDEPGNAATAPVIGDGLIFNYLLKCFSLLWWSLNLWSLSNPSRSVSFLVTTPRKGIEALPGVSYGSVLQVVDQITSEAPSSW